MKKLFLILTLSLLATSANAVDFSSKFSVGTRTSVTTGNVKVTGESKEWSNTKLTGVKGDYDISVYPCSDCANDVDKGNDFSVIGDYKSREKSVTSLDITQDINNYSSGYFCKVDTELGGFKAGNSSERLTHENVTITENKSITNVKGGSLFEGVVYDGTTPIGSVKEGSSYNQNIATNLTTTTTENKTSYNVGSYFGN